MDMIPWQKNFTNILSKSSSFTKRLEVLHTMENPTISSHNLAVSLLFLAKYKYFLFHTPVSNLGAHRWMKWANWIRLNSVELSFGQRLFILTYFVARFDIRFYYSNFYWPKSIVSVWRREKCGCGWARFIPFPLIWAP